MIEKSRILVIDDEVEVVDLLKKRLEKAGYQVVTATDGPQGFKVAVDEKPDLILLDIIMPDVDGLTVLRQLKAQESTSNIPVVMVSAKSMTDSIFEARKYGATDYIIKPFQWDELLKFVKRYLRLYAK
ncbi:MAG: hypothetical protein AMJ95_00115 [Omnitrophica WOR_2 bacterium SM23_72]|nr:MAG: hypothetical protein AMJ95_00115 [Omnitrophica WOR_2 bacterium SM23_72]